MRLHFFSHKLFIFTIEILHFIVQVPWRDDEELLVAWREGQTGYPWIDAIMIQVGQKVPYNAWIEQFVSVRFLYIEVFTYQPDDLKLAHVVNNS